MTSFRTELSQTFLNVAGCKVNVWRGGRGRPLLFLHGSHAIAKPLPFMSDLADRFDVIAPEHPGFGRSETPAWLKTIHDLAYFYLDLIKALELDEVHVVGQALGGWIAAEMAVRCTARLATLIVVGAPGLDVPSARPIDVFSKSDADLAEFLYHDRTMAAAARDRFLGQSADPVAVKNRDTLHRLASDPWFHDPALHHWLHRIDVPTLVLWGANDRAVPPPIGEAYRSLIPESRLLLLPECGHLPHIEKAAEYVEIVSAFSSAEAVVSNVTATV